MRFILRASLSASSLLILLFCSIEIAIAQRSVYELPAAKVRESYDQNLIEVLRDTYNQVVESDSDDPDFRWTVVAGTLPDGLRLMSNGRLVGTPQLARSRPYIFRLNVVDEASADAKPLLVPFSLQVKSASKKTTQVRLRSADEAENPDDVAADDDNKPKEKKPKPVVTISGADELPPGEYKAQVAFTRKDPKVAYLLVIESRTNLLQHINYDGKNTVSTQIELMNGKNTLRVLAFESNENQLGPLVTKDIMTSGVGPRTEAVILSPPFKTDGISEFPLSVKLVDTGNKMAKLSFEVTANGNKVDGGTQAVDNAKPFQQVLVRILNGKNDVRVVAIDANGISVAEDTTTIECTEKCETAAAAASISLSDPFNVTDDSAAKVMVTPTDSNKNIDFYDYKVADEHGEVQYTHRDPAKLGDDKVRERQLILVKLTEGHNTVSVIGMKKDGENAKPVTKTATTTINCVNCKGNSLAESGSSVYTRAIVGFEQAGASSSESSQKPFLDFFFGAPIAGKGSDRIPPRLATWGQVRFASVPQQVFANTLQNTSTGFLTSIQGLQVNELVQGFDFLAGVDVRLISPKGRGFVDLDPGTRQNTSVSFVAGFGAINPLTKRQTAQIFEIPRIGTDIDPAFLEKFPEAKGKTNIAFVTPERDRFYRQYYGGFRFKTFFYDKHGEIINRFPALLDVTFGQNELVTGKLRNAIFRLEGFYPFPFRSARFVYLYGTAMMKIGGGGVKTSLPLDLNQLNNIHLPDPNTVVVPIDRNPSLRSNREYYRFGLGINLIELLDKLKTPTPK